MADDLSALSQDEIESQVAAVSERMRPLERDLAELRAQRDVLRTELRRRERLGARERRADLKAQIREGALPTVDSLVANSDQGSFDEYRYNLKTGGEVRLGFPGARRQSVAFTDGRVVAQAHDLGEAARLYAAGWSMGSPGRPGVRVHLVGTRQEKLVDPTEIYARLAAAN
jgi:hypothetical protein